MAVVALVASLMAVVALVALGMPPAPIIEHHAWKLFGNAPSIDSLVSNYETHPSQFAALTRMASADPQFGLEMTKHGAYLDSEWAQALTQARIKRYESELRPIGGISMTSGPGDIDINLGTTGLVIGGDSWGYVRSKRPPAPVVTLKQAHATFHDDWCYSLGDEWYVYNFND